MILDECCKNSMWVLWTMINPIISRQSNYVSVLFVSNDAVEVACLEKLLNPG